MTRLAQATLGKLVRVGGFRRELVLNDQLLTELAIYFRDLTDGCDVVAVYPDTTARAYRHHAASSTETLRWAEARSVELLVPLTDVVSVVDAVLAWPVAHETEH